MSSREMRRLNLICQFIEQEYEITEFDIRHHFGISQSLYAQIKSDLQNGSMFTWKVEFDKKRRVWRYIGERQGDVISRGKNKK